MHEDPLHTNHHHQQVSDTRMVGNTARSTHPAAAAAATTTASTDNAAADTAMMNHHHNSNNLPQQGLYTKQGKEEGKNNDAEENNQNDEEHNDDAADNNKTEDPRPPSLHVPVHGQVIKDHHDNDDHDNDEATNNNAEPRSTPSLLPASPAEDEDEENAKQTPPVPHGVVVDDDDDDTDHDHDHYIPTATTTGPPRHQQFQEEAIIIREDDENNDNEEQQYFQHEEDEDTHDDSQVQVQFEVENETGIAVEDHHGREEIVSSINATMEDGIDIYLQQQVLEEKDGEDRFRYTIDVDAMHAVFSAERCDQTIDGASFNRMKMIQIISSRPTYPVRSRMIIRVLITLFLREWEVEQKCNNNNGAGIDRLVVKFIDSFRRGSSMHLREQQLQSDEDALAIDILVVLK